MQVPPAITHEAKWESVVWAFSATDYPNIEILSRVNGCRLVARKTTCGWQFSARTLYTKYPLVSARGSVSIVPGGAPRWSWDTGARRRSW